MRMMREAWRKLGHPVPTYKNDRAWKAFEFFIPELDKEVDMASDLVKAMFSSRPSPDIQSGVESGVESAMSTKILSFLASASLGKSDISRKLGKNKPTRYLNELMKHLIHKRLVEYTIPGKPNSRLQKYRLPAKSRRLPI